MASSAVAAAAMSERPAVSAQSGEARIIDGTLLAKYAIRSDLHVISACSFLVS